MEHFIALSVLFCPIFILFFLCIVVIPMLLPLCNQFDNIIFFNLILYFLNYVLLYTPET